MSFKFFRKHEKLMLWIIVVVTIFTFSIFSVTSTMRACFQPRDLPLAAFVSATGKKVEVTEHMYRHAWELLRKMAPLLGLKEVTQAEIYPHLILDYEAREGDLKVTDGELKAFLSNLRFIKSSLDYDNLVRNLGFTTRKKFEEGLREVLRVAKLKQILRSPEDLIRLEDLYDEFKIENEEFQLVYVAFSPDDFAGEITPDKVDEKALAAWYEGLTLSSKEVRDLFSEPEKFSFDVAYLDLEHADYDAFKDLLEKTKLPQIQDIEYRQRFDLTKERFALNPGPEEGKKEGGGEQAGAGEGGEGKEKKEEIKYRNPDDPEVRKILEREIRLGHLVQKANEEWTAFARAQKIIGKKTVPAGAPEGGKAGKEEKPGKKEPGEEDEPGKQAGKGPGETGGGPCLPGEGRLAAPQEGTGGGETGKDAPKQAPEEAAGDVAAEKGKDQATPKDPEAFFQALVSKYHLSLDHVKGPVPLDELETLPRYGSVTLKQDMLPLKINNGRYVPPSQEHPYLAMMVRVTDLVPRRKKALSEVHDAAVKQYLLKLRSDRAEQEAEAFFAALKTKARALPEVKKQIETWQEEARQAAEKEIAGKKDLTGEEAEKIRNQALKDLDAQVDDFVKRYLYLVFEEEAAARGHAVEKVDYFRKSEVRDPEFLEAEDTPEKFVKSNTKVLALDTHGVSEPLQDAKTRSWYVVEVKDRRFPPPGAMTQADLDKYRKRAEQMRSLRRRYPQYFAAERPDPFTYENMVEKYKLVLYTKKKEKTPRRGAPSAAGAGKAGGGRPADKGADASK